MIASADTYKETSSKRIGLVAPVPPPNGGMAMQALKLADKLGKEGMDVAIIPTNPDFPGFLRCCRGVPGVRTIIRFCIYCLQLRNLHRKDVVHIFAASHLFFFLSVVPALCMAKILGVRTVLNYRGGEAETFFNCFGRFVRPFFSLADVIVVPSEFLQEVFGRKLSLESEVLPNVADNDVFVFRKREGLQPIFVVARQLEPIYGHHTILKAFAWVRQEFPEAVLKIAGGGSLRKELEEMVTKLDLGGVQFWGTLDHQSLAKVYDSCDIMLNASVADNFPGALIEAFLCGLPVVTTNAGGISFMVKDRVNGLLVEPGDDIGLAEAMLELLHNPSLGIYMANEGYKYAKSYHWPEIRKKILSIYFGHSARHNPVGSEDQ